MILSRLSLVLFLASGTARALSPQTCTDLLRGTLGWTREIANLRILNQGCNPTCWLHTGTGLLENSMKETKKRVPLSAAYLQHHSIRDQAKRLHVAPQGAIDWTGQPAEALVLVREHGILPDSVWTPKIPLEKWDLRQDIEPRLRRIAEAAQAEGLSFTEYMRRVDAELEAIYGTPPENFRLGWLGARSYDAQTFRDARTVLGDPKLRIENVMLREGLESNPACDLATCQSFDEATARAAASIDAGQPVAIGFDLHRAERNRELGLWTLQEGSQRSGGHGAVLVAYLRGEDGRIVAWKALNSWGDKHAQGFYVFPDAFLRQRMTDMTFLRQD